MHRNTFILVIFLALAATLVVGVNIGRSVGSVPPEIVALTVEPPSPTPQIKLEKYTSSACGISVEYPSTFVKLDNPLGGAMLGNSENTKDIIAITCQEDIPRVPLAEDKIETVHIGSVSAKLYHDASAKDGTPVDKLIFRHPKRKTDVYMAGFGEAFNEIISTITIF